MKRIEGSFSGARLRLARDFHGLSGASLAEQVAVAQQFLSQLEAGTKTPGESLLAALSDVLHFDPSFFFDPPFEEFKDGECRFRSRKTTPQRVKKRALAHGSLFGILVSYFDSRLRLPLHNVPDFLSRGALRVDEVAERCRIHWGVGTDVPITSMTRLLENAGVVVTKFVGNTAKVDAFSRAGKRDIVVLNTEKGESHNRWDLAHECGHLVLHRGLVCDSMGDVFEDEANAFASALLLPAKAFTREFRPQRLEWGLLFDLKRRWSVSIAALVRRAYNLGLLDAAQYRRAYKYIHAKGWHTGEPFEPIKENPEIVPLALKLLEKRGQPPTEVARHLHWHPVVMEEVIGLPLPRPSGPLAEVASFDSYRKVRSSGSEHS
jgi:Zn-dependent peptidase ImmA (M78 family)/transcriptional regulator with XRE-family HTH domain